MSRFSLFALILVCVVVGIIFVEHPRMDSSAQMGVSGGLLPALPSQGGVYTKCDKWTTKDTLWVVPKIQPGYTVIDTSTTPDDTTNVGAEYIRFTNYTTYLQSQAYGTIDTLEFYCTSPAGRTYHWRTTYQSPLGSQGIYAFPTGPPLDSLRVWGPTAQQVVCFEGRY